MNGTIEDVQLKQMCQAYYIATLQASNDRSNRVLRGKIIESLLGQAAEERPLFESDL